MSGQRNRRPTRTEPPVCCRSYPQIVLVSKRFTPNNVGVSNIHGSVNPMVNVRYRDASPNCHSKLRTCPAPPERGSLMEKLLIVNPSAPVTPNAPLYPTDALTLSL